VVLALLGLATIDLVFLLPILCGMAALFFGLSVGCLGLIVGGSYLLVNMLPFGWEHAMANPLGQALIGIGLIAGAIGMGALLLWLMEIIAKLLIKYARLHFRLFDSANASL
jgi:uncharacterized membrane protein